jgi:predicted metalloprotease
LLAASRLTADTCGEVLPMNDDDAAMPESAGSTERSEPGVAARRAGPPRPTLIGAGVVGAIVLILVAILLLRPDDAPVAHTSPRASTASPPSTSTGPATPSASAEQGAVPTSSALPSEQETWTKVATFAKAGNRYVLGDMEPWAGGVVADESGRGGRRHLLDRRLRAAEA